MLASLGVDFTWLSMDWDDTGAWFTPSGTSVNIGIVISF